MTAQKMFRSFSLGLGLTLLTGVGAQAADWVKLYNGKDLAGWHAKDGKIEAWKANGDMISCTGEGGGWLTSDKQYENFDLRLDYRIPPGGNSGVGIRYPAVGDPAHIAIEIQILDDEAPVYKDKLQAAQYNGGIYYQVAPTKKTARPPGQWNTYEITCKGPEIIVKLNGEVINRTVLDKETVAKGDYASLAERYRKNPRGHIGLQSHGNQVDFKNIEIREL